MILSAAVVITDIEGTTTPIAFVHDVLFPYARRALPSYVAAHPEDADVREAARAAPDGDALAALLGWMDADAKIAPLKSLQGKLWREGYLAGDIAGVLYPDVAPALRRWHAAGARLCVYSSGSVQAQRLLFGHTAEGDLCPLFSGFFDTNTGAKRDAASYTAIARALDADAGSCLFLSDVEAELDAAGAAGMQTCQLVRPADGTVPSSRHPTQADFSAISFVE
jgi:enolase-phosphatase E1